MLSVFERLLTVSLFILPVFAAEWSHRRHGRG